MKGKKIRGQIHRRASMIQPRRKKVRVVFLSALITGPRWSRFTKSKLAMSSALPNTAGITVVKLNVVQKAYSKGVNISMPMYVQFWVRMFSSSKIHQTGAETRKSPTYLRGLRLSKDVPVRHRTSPSIVRQYPNHNGKNPQWVRAPVKVQLSAQNRMTNPSPNQPCKGNFDPSFSRVLLLIVVVIRQVYTENPKNIGVIQ